jgi:DNA polymerase-4
MRSIFHVDMDAFFVSVEELYDPSLKGKPVVVGGARDQRGVVSAASYAARKFGVRSAMPLRTAAKLCPQAIFVEGHPDRYREHSRRVRTVFDGFTPAVEMASIDEAYLDMTGTERLNGPPFRTAHLVHEAIRAAASLNCSIGASRTRLVSKIASDQAKPNGVLWIPPGREAEFLAPLDVSRIPGVGKVTSASLTELGIRRIGDLARLDEVFLSQRFGRWGLAMAGKAQGEDAGGWFDSAVGESEHAKSISHEHTFGEDTADAAELEGILDRLAEMVADRLRASHLYGRTVHLKLRYHDFTTFTRAKTLAERTAADRVVGDTARALFRRAWNRGVPVRLLGVGVSDLESEPGQANLFDDGRWTRTLEAVDDLRRRFGPDTVSLARGLKSKFRERTHEALPETEADRSDNRRSPAKPSRPDSAH